MKPIYLIFAVVFVLSSCGNSKVAELETSYKRVEITRDFLRDESAELKFELVDTINLEALGNPPLTAVQDLAFSDNFFLLLDNKQGLLKFDNSGSFLQKIGEMGEGPEEYITPYAIHLDEKENIVLVADWQKRTIISYDLEGTFDSSSQRLPGRPISFYKDNDTLLVVQETLNGAKEKPRQVLVSSIEPTILEAKNQESPLYDYHSNYTIIHPIPRILTGVKNANLFYLPIIRGDIASHSATDTIFRKEGDQLVPEYLLHLSGFDNTHQLGINHVVMSYRYAFLRVVYENRSHYVVIDFENNCPLVYLRQLFDRELTEETIPRPLNGDLFYSILRDEESIEERNPMIVIYRINASNLFP